MKASLTFTLPEEAEEHRTALDGHRWRTVVEEIDRALRSTVKHGEEPYASHATWARDLLYQVLDENEVTL